MNKARLLTAALVACCGVLNASVQAQDWVQTTAPIAAWVSLASSADGTKLVAAASADPTQLGGPILTSKNSGVTWTQTSAPIRHWSSLASSADGTRLAATGGEVGPPQPIYISTNSGATWTAHPPISTWYIVTSSADGTRLVGLGTTDLYTSSDSGTTWNTATPSNYPTNGFGFESLASSADGTKLAAFSREDPISFYSEFWSSTNGGSSWDETDGLLGNSIGGLASSADGLRLVVALASIGIYTSTNAGQSWEQSNASPDEWSSVASSADGTRMVAAAHTVATDDFLGRLYTSIDSGASWVQADAPHTNWSTVTCSADGKRLIAAVHNGGIYTWQAALPPRLDTPSSSILEQNNNLATTNWAPVATMPISTNGQYQVILSLNAGGSFYRLKHP